MSNYIARKYIGGYTFVFHREGTVHVEIQGKHRAYDICDALCDPYDGTSLIGYDTMVPFDDYIKYAWLRIFPHMEYAYKKCGDMVTADELAMITYVNKHPYLESLLNNPHNKRYAYFNYMWTCTCDHLSAYEKDPVMLKRVIRNFHDASIEQCMYIPPSKAHEPQYRWVADMAKNTSVSDITLIELANGWLTEKDMNYVIKLHAKAPREFRLDEQWIALESYISYRGMLRDATREGLLPDNVMDDPYWVYPSPASLYARRDRVYGILTDFYEGQESHVEFDSHMERYKKYPVDITVDGFRFYTTTSRESWIRHSDALKQCCYRLKYYAHDTSILTFVEKDGVPYGTIDYSLSEHQIIQARIDQSDYIKSNMPTDVVKLFMKHVISMLENN